MSRDINEMSFENALSELETIVQRLELGELTLDDSLREFERGIGLYGHCLKTLDTAEGKIKMILEEHNGEIKEVDFTKDA